MKPFKPDSYHLQHNRLFRHGGVVRHQQAAAAAAVMGWGDGLHQAVRPPGTVRTMWMTDMCWTPYVDSFSVS